MASETILWQRLDTPGHDACRLVEREDERRIQGAAVFHHETGPAALVYEVEYDREWRTQEGVVKGWIGSSLVDVRITRSSVGVWTLNGELVRNLQECLDLDLGFTPATNLAQLRRIALEVGQAADFPVAWIDAPFRLFEVLQQKYERRGLEEYWYESPQSNYTALLHVGAAGFVQRYPSLWEAES